MSTATDILQKAMVNVTVQRNAIMKNSGRSNNCICGVEKDCVQYC